MIARYGRYSPNSNPAQKPPYNHAQLDRFEDTFRSDGVAQRGIIKRAYLVMGKHGKIVMDTTDEYDDEQQRKEAIQKVQANAKYQAARKQIQKLHIKPEINFHNNVMSELIQAKVYGRAALEIVTEGQYELPTALHLCNSKRLDRVEVETNPNTWRFLGVHYLDINKGTPGPNNDLLRAEDIIYMANKDYHISPGALYYGLSDLEAVIDGSEAKRIAKQEDIKETLKQNWARTPFLKFHNTNVSNTEMQEVIDAVEPGIPVGTRQDVTLDYIETDPKLKQMSEMIDFLNRETIRDLGMPSFITGYEQIANYANSQQILLALKEIELDAERTWLADVIDKQWLNRYFYQLLGYGPEDEIEVKLKYEFSDVSFETVLDKTNFALNLFHDNLISGEKVLKIADMEDEIDEYKVRRDENMKLKQRQQEIELRRQDTEEMLAKNQVSTTPRMRTAKLEEIEEAKKAYRNISKAAEDLI